MCGLAIALACLFPAGMGLADDTSTQVVGSVSWTRPAPITRAELAQLDVDGVAVREVQDYIFGGYQGDFSSPPHADLNPQRAFVICWKDFPFRFVFSHEASYCPWFELPSGAAVSYQFFEGNLGWAELFNNWGRQERNTSVEILEPGPDRVWVRWIYFGVNMTSGQPAYRGIEDFWAYPNGLIVRRQTFDSLLKDDPRGYAREPIELIGLSPAGKRWCDVLRQVSGSDERHALAVLDVFSDRRYDVFWKPLPGTVWDSTHRRSGGPWRDLDDSAGVITAIPLTDGAPFCAFGDNSGFRHDTTRIKDLTFEAEAWGSMSWDHWPIGWLNSQAHVVDAESLPHYPNHFSPLGMDLFALSDEQVEQREFYSLLGVSDGDWEATRRSVRQWLENVAGLATPDSAAGLPVVWASSTGVYPRNESGLAGQAGNKTRSSTMPVNAQTPQVPLDYGQVVNGFQDDFSGDVRDPNWVAVPADRDQYKQADGVLHVTSMDVNPSHLLYEAPGYDGADQEVLARIRVKAGASGANPIAGISVASNPDTPHAGEAVNFIFLKDPGDCLGAAGPVLRLVDDWRAWGPAVPEFAWETGVWYWLRLGQTGTIAAQDTNIHAKIWRADGSEPEPADWQIEWARDGRTGFAGIRGPHDGSPAEFEVDYVLIKADGLPRIQVAPAVCSPRRVVVIREDVHVRERTEWRDADYQIHGNMIFHEGGELVVDRATVSLMCTYTREFRYQWEGGTLVTRNVTIGGAKKDGIVYQTNFEIQSGAWESEDTTIEYSSGVCMGWTGHPVKFHATRLKAGPDPDSIIMSAAPADVVLKDSVFNISLTASASEGGQGRLDLPVDRPITRVFDHSSVPGVKSRLELVNTQVPLWWVFFSGIQHGGPPTEIVLGDCPRLIPSIIAYDLQGALALPAPWPAQPEAMTDLTIGNLTLKTVGQTVHTWCWGLYLSGEKTDVSLRGNTSICELFLADGRLVVEGDAGTFNSLNSCTTVEVGHRNVMNIDPSKQSQTDVPAKPVELVMRNVALGRFMAGDVIIGQITAHTDGQIRIEHARCANLKLLTKGNGTIIMRDIDRHGKLESIENGGAITIEEVVPLDARLDMPEGSTSYLLQK